jgi:hypothetical protein
MEDEEFGKFYRDPNFLHHCPLVDRESVIHYLSLFDFFDRSCLNLFQQGLSDEELCDLGAAGVDVSATAYRRKVQSMFSTRSDPPTCSLC